MITFYDLQTKKVYMANSPISQNDIGIEPCPEDLVNAIYDPQICKWVVPDEELDKQAREKRNQLLADTDFYFMSDYPLSEENSKKLKAYRQALRDITKQESYPKDIVWPSLED